MTPGTWSASGQIDALPVPAHGSVVFAAKSSEKKYNFSNNFLIIKDHLDAVMTSAAYSEMNNLQTTRKYLEYSPVKSAEILFKDGDVSKAYVFEAKYNSNTPRMRFVQTAKICGLDVYLLHFTVALDRDPDNYIALTKTFECK